jgi:hypothetical protein
MAVAQSHITPAMQYIKPWTLFPTERKGAEDTKEWIEKNFKIQVSPNIWLTDPTL